MSPRRSAARLLAIVGLIATPVHAAVEVTDDVGAKIILSQPARRIVSLAPHLTEQLFTVGAGDRIVGTTEFADFPAAAQKITRVARAHGVDLERVAALKPDLIVLWGSGFPPATAAALRRLDVPVFISEPGSLADIASSLQRIGVLTGLDGAAAAADFRRKIDSARNRYSARAPVRVFYQVWSAPLMTLSGRHVISEAIELCGGRNVFADLAPLVPQISTEAVLSADPELILTAEPARRASDALDGWKRFPNLPAVRNQQLKTLDADRMNRHGPRLADEVNVLCEVIDGARTKR
ncbi:MAG TPA: cobalamin-binding protein [Pseudomonadales bacterium]